MRIKNIFLLSLTSLVLFSAASCKKRRIEVSSSSSEERVLSISFVSPDEVLENAANIVWNKYKDLNNQYVYEDFEISKREYALDNYLVDISWTISYSSESHDGVILNESANPQGKQKIKVGYYDFTITNDFDFELVPTLNYKGITKKLTDILGEDKKIVRKVKKIIFASFDEYKTKCNLQDDKNKMVALNGYIVGFTRNNKYIFIQDESNGYLIRSDRYTRNEFKVGDKVSISGKAINEKGMYYVYDPLMVLIEKTSSSYQKPDYKDITTTLLTNDSLEDIQNMRIKISGVKLLSRDGNDYKFTFNNREYIMKKDSNYFFNDEENEILFRDFTLEKSANIYGIFKYEEGKIYFYPDSMDSIEIID